MAIVGLHAVEAALSWGFVEPFYLQRTALNSMGCLTHMLGVPGWMPLLDKRGGWVLGY